MSYVSTALARYEINSLRKQKIQYNRFDHTMRVFKWMLLLYDACPDKEILFQDIPMELVLLMEADLLDDTGAQALVMDAWFEVVGEEQATFESILEHMESFSVRQMQDNPMRTEKGKQLWEDKRRLTEAFVEAYREDLRK